VNAYDALPDNATEIFGEEATAARAYDLLTVDVPLGSWIAALEIARDKLGCTYFDWLSAVDEPGTGFRVSAHVVALEGRTVRRLLVRTTVPHTAPVLPTAVEIYAGASWHERETHEMFGIDFADHPHLVPLLLPDTFEGHPLRKDFVLAARVAKAWPGAKEPGESEHGGPKRRQMLPPGVPDPNEWGPLKGQLPPAPARPARGARAAGAAGAGADRPARGARAAGAAGTGAAAADRPPRRSRSVTEGSASQTAEPTPGTTDPGATDPGATDPGTTEPPAAPPATPAPSAKPRRSRSAADGSASQTAAPAAPAAPESESGTAAPTRPAPAPDAPWHDPKPAFTPDPAPEPEAAPVTDPPASTDTAALTDTAAPTNPAAPTDPPAKATGADDPDHPTPAGGDTA
jgi:NADH:ubiquinone oxidoreductase subunit C